MRKAFQFMVMCAGLVWSPVYADQYPSSCWMLTDLQGMAFFQEDGYAPQIDQFSQPLRLILNGDQTNVGKDSLSMSQIGEFMALGFGKSDAFTTVETYQVDASLGIVLYTKAVNAQSIFSKMSGARAFSGRAERCK